MPSGHYNVSAWAKCTLYVKTKNNPAPRYIFVNHWSLCVTKQNCQFLIHICLTANFPILKYFLKVSMPHYQHMDGHFNDKTDSWLSYCSGSLEPESSCHDRYWIMELPMEADILTFTGIFTPEDASVASCFPFDNTISLSWFPLLSIPPLHSAIP